MRKNVLSKKITDEPILVGDPLFQEIHEVVAENMPTIQKLNTGYHSLEEIREILSEIIGEKVASSVAINLPFYTDFGKHISIGENVFINSGVILTDLGGIILEDNVLLGPQVKILSVNHPVEPALRRGLILKPVVIKNNAWIGAGATILPGVTVGENAIVGANATVTKDVPPNTIVVGTPAKVVKSITI